MPISPSEPPAPTPPPDPSLPDSHDRLRAAVAAGDWIAAEAWCRQEKQAHTWSWLRRALSAFRR